MTSTMYPAASNDATSLYMLQGMLDTIFMCIYTLLVATKTFMILVVLIANGLELKK